LWARIAGKREQHVPLLNRSRDKFDDRRTRSRNAAPENSTFPPLVVAQRRRGLNDAELKRSVTENVAQIINTIDLQSCADLQPFDYVRKSIINYGVYDLSSMTGEGERVALIEQNLLAAIICYEPRIVRETIEVKRLEASDEVSQKLQLVVRADIKSHPIDVEIDLVADVDFSLSKVSLTRTSI
jgi:type VI secretion system protein ImpF